MNLIFRIIYLPVSILDPLVSEAWKSSIENLTSKKVEILRVSIVGGGSINDARRIETTEGTFFAKMNSAEEFPKMFETESQGLDFLKEQSPFRIPKTIATGSIEDIQWILMENIRSASKRADFWEEFGRKLAIMHKNSSGNFGLDYDNYLGNLPQKNDRNETWEAFFAEMRIQPQLDLAKGNKKTSTEFLRLFDKMLSRIDRYFPKEPPAALHGDLWTGNFMTDSFGEAVVFDPSVYYGHREMDLGMSKLFGGFDEKFYDAYHEEYPLEPGWEERIHVANLYPLLAHVNIFGGSYTAQVIQILRRHI